MTEPKRLGRPPTGKRKRQVFVFLHEEHATWFMAIPPQERTAWLVKQIQKAQQEEAK